MDNMQYIAFIINRYFNSKNLWKSDKCTILKYSKLLNIPLTKPSFKGKKDQFNLSKVTKNNPLVKALNKWEKNIIFISTFFK